MARIEEREHEQGNEKPGNMEKANLQEIVGRFGSSRIIILGDVMLDRYIFGEVNRISPEAPAPVVEVKREAVAPGGASNVAANIKALGDTPFVIGVTGDDGADELLRGEFERRCLTADYLIVDKSRKTTLKTRIIAESQQIARIDREQTHEISAEIEDEVLTNFEKIAGDAKALIISDYGKGMITESLLERLIPLAREKGLFVAVDPKETHFMNYKDVSLITPNHHEASFAAGRRIRNESDLLEVGDFLMERLGLGSLLITRGKDGMSLFERNHAGSTGTTGSTGTSGATPVHTRLSANAREVYDVTGAGDTVIAVFTSAISAGATLKEASVLANTAAGMVVGEIGAATVSMTRLHEELKSFAGEDALKI